MSDLPTLGPGFSPNRVVVDAEGYAVNSRRAREQYGVIPDVILLRNDGWTLAAPHQFVDVAFTMWRDEWTHFVVRPSTEWRPIFHWLQRHQNRDDVITSDFPRLEAE